MSKVIVFIDSPCPNEWDISLACLHGTREFRDKNNHSGIEEHDVAVAVDPGWIPEGYKTV